MLFPKVYRSNSLQCGIDLVNEEAREKAKATPTGDGMATRKKRESSVQQFGWNKASEEHTGGRFPPFGDVRSRSKPSLLDYTPA